jgi:hypothetical protein
MKILGFRYEPAMIVYAVNAAVALVVAFGANLSHDQVAAVTTVTTAVLAIVTAVLTRPIVVSTITGAVGTALAAVAAFGLHLSADQIGATVTALSIALALLLRSNVSPAATAPSLTRSQA